MTVREAILKFVPEPDCWIIIAILQSSKKRTVILSHDVFYRSGIKRSQLNVTSFIIFFYNEYNHLMTISDAEYIHRLTRLYKAIDAGSQAEKERQNMFLKTKRDVVINNRRDLINSVKKYNQKSDKSFINFMKI